MSDLFVRDQTILDYSLSAMRLNPSVPRLYGTVTPPQGTTANLIITVFLFENADSHLPYTSASGSVAVSPGLLTTFDANNGLQDPPNKVPKRIEIQIVTSAEVRAKKVSVLLP